ncbi:hypothetical protein KC322_g31 [Hortaea werneckii]|nr:hypothetical protein KC322_g31 [Hortaea werneckii]
MEVASVHVLVDLAPAMSRRVCSYPSRMMTPPRSLDGFDMRSETQTVDPPLLGGPLATKCYQRSSLRVTIQAFEHSPYEVGSSEDESLPSPKTRVGSPYFSAGFEGFLALDRMVYACKRLPRRRSFAVIDQSRLFGRTTEFRRAKSRANVAVRPLDANSTKVGRLKIRRWRTDRLLRLAVAICRCCRRSCRLKISVWAPLFWHLYEILMKRVKSVRLEFFVVERRSWVFHRELCCVHFLLAHRAHLQRGPAFRSLPCLDSAEEDHLAIRHSARLMTASSQCKLYPELPTTK